MTLEIWTIETKTAIAGVNSYLVKDGTGYFLIDTGFKTKRGDLEKALEGAGCRPGDLKLIIITHGDTDHIGNAPYLREKYGAKIAMHKGDAGMAERGDMFWNRRGPNVLVKSLISAIMYFLRMRPARFTPDILFEGGEGLAGYGFDATVHHTPGHSSGSIGVLTAGGDLFCGDLVENIKGPRLGSIMDDAPAAKASVEKLKGIGVKAVYPGHGKPFQLAELAK